MKSTVARLATLEGVNVGKSDKVVYPEKSMVKEVMAVNKSIQVPKAAVLEAVAPVIVKVVRTFQEASQSPIAPVVITGQLVA